MASSNSRQVAGYVVRATIRSGFSQSTAVDAEFRASIEEMVQKSFPIRPESESYRPSNVVDELLYKPRMIQE